MSLVATTDQGIEVDLSLGVYRDIQFALIGDDPLCQELGLRVTYPISSASFLVDTSEADHDGLGLGTLASALTKVTDEMRAAMDDARLRAQVEAAGATVGES